ncbi:uncharacterized protein LOC110999223 isoform X4 [Pieris rapae]|uniref:uncharacterized protein LOC110999223 isoform X4 n=1 Tax=Pieris rapae TaxID=64459 RepID=UPI001E281369|nr:uncharacterized protein LOC110999223 isoform X4 [Pieris rapae]
MRGSTAGLADTLSTGSRAHSALLQFADEVFGSAIVAPAVVTYWKATWSLMDLYVLPHEPVNSAIVALVLGMGLNFFLCVFQTQLSKHIRPDKGRFTYYVLSRLYTCVAAVGCVGAWRGVWNLLNECTGDSAQTVMSTTAAATLSLAALRTLRNIIAAPFAVVVDAPKDFFDVPTMFRTSSKETALYILDCVFSVTVVGSLVVFVWRGLWALIDIYLYPDDPVKSCWTSLIVGYSMVVVTFSLQAPMRWVVARLQGAPRLLIADVYHLLSFASTVNVWRGVWGLLDIYFLPDSPLLSNWSCHIVSLALLILLNCSNSILVRGVYIDAEEPAGECVIFPCHYLRLFFHKEKTKRHKALDLTKKMEEASVPLQTPEEKV